MSLPKKRDAILYVRVTEENKKFVEKQGNKLGVSDSAYVDDLLDKERAKKRVSRKKKLSKRT